MSTEPCADGSEDVTRKIRFRGTPCELAELLLTLAEHGVSARLDELEAEP